MFKRQGGLSKKEIDGIFYKLCLAICEMKNPQEAAELLRDLLFFQESRMIAKRLKIAELLLSEATYDEISSQLKVGSGTIARVHEWLKISGDGYRRAIQRTKINCADDNFPVECSDEWLSIKRKYPAYFWPEKLLENILKSSGIRQREKIRSAIREMEKAKEKAGIYRKYKKFLLLLILILPNILNL
jgi:uncharacterized protein YerC